MRIPAAHVDASREYLPALTGLRFWLAVWVIVHHICGKGMMLETQVNALPYAAARLLHGGYMAVQTFFVLSGFVLARTYTRVKWDQQTLGRFFTARFARIYPTYLVSLLVLSPFIVEMLVSPPWTPEQRTRAVTCYLFLLQGWTGSLRVGWNTPAWSLSCEFFFYVCFPVLFTLLRNARWRAIVVALAAAVVMPAALSSAGVPQLWKPVYYLADFVAGIAAARIFAMLSESAAWKKRGYWLYLPAITIGGWLIAHPALSAGSYFDLSTRLRPLNIALVVGLALGGGWLAKFVSGPRADFLGKASYSMYVLHVPILWWTGRYFLPGTLHVPAPIGAATYLALVILGAGLIYRYFETPAGEWIRKRRVVSAK